MAGHCHRVILISWMQEKNPAKYKGIHLRTKNAGHIYKTWDYPAKQALCSGLWVSE